MTELRATYDDANPPVCRETGCIYRRTCANHETAGGFRHESGFTPELRLKEGGLECKTKARPPHGELCGYPANVGTLKEGELTREDLRRDSRERDPVRIEKVLERLRRLWKRFPDFRLGQLMEALAKVSVGTNKLEADSLSRLEEEDLLAAIEKYEAEEKG